MRDTGRLVGVLALSEMRKGRYMRDVGGEEVDTLKNVVSYSVSESGCGDSCKGK